MKFYKSDFNFIIINKGFFIFLITLTSFVFLSFTLPKNVSKKVTKSIKKTFNVTNFTLKTIDLDVDTNVINSNNFCSIHKEDEIIGYALIDKAASKMLDFDYLVLLNPELEIVTIKILIYREEHGNEISSKRWLKQFFGLKINDRAILNKNIDGISGATISVRSMTKKIDDLLIDLKVVN
ncbi:MAG: FMN-binding protein [Flavobacteriaceae bacterium]